MLAVPQEMLALGLDKYSLNMEFPEYEYYFYILENPLDFPFVVAV